MSTAPSAPPVRRTFGSFGDIVAPSLWLFLVPAVALIVFRAAEANLDRRSAARLEESMKRDPGLDADDLREGLEWIRRRRGSRLAGTRRRRQRRCGWMTMPHGRGGRFRATRRSGCRRPRRGTASARPVTFGDVYATLFRHLGIDPASTTITDNQGRPQYLVEDGGTPIAELL